MLYKWSSKLGCYHMFTTCFTPYFKPTVKSYYSKTKGPFKMWVLIDNAPGHPRPLIEMYRETNVVFIPATTTSFFQAMNWHNFSFQVLLFKKYILWLGWCQQYGTVKRYFCLHLQWVKRSQYTRDTSAEHIKIWRIHIPVHLKVGGLEHREEIKAREQQRWCLQTQLSNHSNWVCSPREPYRSREGGTHSCLLAS